MTAFVDSFSTQQLLPPWISKGARSWAFIIEVDRSCIQNYLDSHFNMAAPDQAPYRYEAMDGATYGMLQVARHPDFSSGQSDPRGSDTLQHTEVVWIFPVYRYRTTPDNLLVERKQVWVQPFVFDDSSYFMFSSTEIWGTETELATILVEEDSSARLRHIDVAIEGLKKFSPRSKSHKIGCIHIEMGKDQTPGDFGALLESNPEMASFIGTLAFSVVSSGPSKTPGVAEINTLKQFRDVFDMDRAAFRAIVASQNTHTDFKEMQVYDGSQVTIDFMWSDSTAEAMQELFGLKEPKGKKVRSGHPSGGPAIDEHGIDWDMPPVRVPVKMVLSFTSDIRFDILETLHIYGV